MIDLKTAVIFMAIGWALIIPKTVFKCIMYIHKKRDDLRFKQLLLDNPLAKYEIHVDITEGITIMQDGKCAREIDLRKEWLKNHTTEEIVKEVHKKLTEIL